MGYNINLKQYQVANFMNENGLQRVIHRPRSKSYVDEFGVEYFNVMERENWAI